MHFKNILVIYKKSIYEYYFLERGSSSAKKCLFEPALVKEFKAAHKAHCQTLNEVLRVLRRDKVSFKEYCRGQKCNYGSFDFIITIGGDGTFLEAARCVSHQPILGVNSDPGRSIGRLCSANHKNFGLIFSRILQGDAGLRKLNRIKLDINHGATAVNVLNEILVCHRNPAAMSRYCLEINGRRENQRSSGLWVATARGSSGAIHSAGGRLLSKWSQKIQYRPRELFMDPQAKYRFKGGVLTFQKPIHIYSMMREGMIYVDGAHCCLPFGLGEVAHITLSAQPLNIFDLPA